MTIKEALEHLDAARIEWNEGYAYQKPRFEALDMAIKALKAQEPRLITKADFENADGYNYIPAWCEERIGGAGYWIMIIPIDIEEEDLRYWTSKPSLKQMEETPWQAT